MSVIKLKPTMTATKINSYLKSGGKFLFKKGTYKLAKVLRIYSNTEITCEDGVVFERNHSGRMVQFFVDGNTTKYNGTHDVKWSGGILKADTNSGNASVFVLFHCKDVEFTNVVVDGCVGLHSFEINACKNVTISGCTCKNQHRKDGETFREAIQLDYANFDGIAIKDVANTAKCYDGTYTDEISIIKCKFDNCPNGIGTHSVSYNEGYHTNTKITNCIFSNILKDGIKLVGFKNATIKNCSGAPISVNKIGVGHKLSGGKFSIPERGNVNIVIDNVKIA